MTTTAIIILAVMILFVIGSLSALKPTPHEQSLDRLRQKARDEGLTARLVAAPEWSGHRTRSGKPGGMVGYYYIQRPELKTRLTRAVMHEGALRVVQGDVALDRLPWNLPGNFAVELNDGEAGVYWDEEKDIAGKSLAEMRQKLEGAVDHLLDSQKKRAEEQAYLQNDQINEDEIIEHIRQKY